MIRLGHLSAVLLITLGATGCGVLGDFSRLPSSEGMTVVRFTSATESLSSPIQAFSILGGGIQVYIQGISGTPFSGAVFLPNENSTQSFSVPNGSYRIGALSWSASSFQGTVRCGFVDDGLKVQLTGGTKTVQLTLSSALCTPTLTPEIFAPDAHLNAGEFIPVEVVTCKAAGFAAVSTGGSSACDSVQIGRVKSMRIELSGYRTEGVTYSELSPMAGGCVDVTSGTPYLTSAFKLPLGNAEKVPAIVTRIVTFDQPGCESGGPVTATYIFPYGLLNTADLKGLNSFGNDAVLAAAKVYSSSGKTQVYLREVF